MHNKTTDGLTEILRTTPPEQVGQVLADHEEKLMAGEKPFALYMRELLRKHGLTQNHIIEKAGFTLPYGYRLLSEERHTRQRDYILRFCIAAEFSLEETQRLLKLYGMSPLYPRIPRDAVLLAAIGGGNTDIPSVNRLLAAQNMAPLRECYD